MSDSILNTTKKLLGLADDYTAFDIDVRMHINAVFAKLHQLGIGPPTGFKIEDDTPTWDDYLLGDMRLNSVPELVYLRCRLIFDPPTSPHALSALEKVADETEWRLVAYRDESLAVVSVPVVVEEEV